MRQGADARARGLAARREEASAQRLTVLMARLEIEQPAIHDAMVTLMESVVYRK